MYIVISAVIPGYCPLRISAIVKLYTTTTGFWLAQVVLGSRHANRKYLSHQGSVRFEEGSVGSV